MVFSVPTSEDLKFNKWEIANWVCLDARGPGGLAADSSDLPTGAAGALISNPSSHRLGHPRTWRASAPITHAARSGCTVTYPHVNPTGTGWIAARCSRLVRSRRRLGHPRCAASGPSSHPSLTGPRGRAAHSVKARGVDCAVCCLLPVFRSVTHRARCADSGRGSMFCTGN